MAATPADITAYTNDGVVLTSPQDVGISAAIKAAHIDARGGVDREIPMFFDLPEHGQVLLDERFSFLRLTGPFSFGIELEDALDLGAAIALVPAVPRWRCIDDRRGISVVCRTRAYAYNMGTDRFSIEVRQ